MGWQVIFTTAAGETLEPVTGFDDDKADAESWAAEYAAMGQAGLLPDLMGATYAVLPIREDPRNTE